MFVITIHTYASHRNSYTILRVCSVCFMCDTMRGPAIWLQLLLVTDILDDTLRRYKKLGWDSSTPWVKRWQYVLVVMLVHCMGWLANRRHRLHVSSTSPPSWYCCFYQGDAAYYGLRLEFRIAAKDICCLRRAVGQIRPAKLLKKVSCLLHNVLCRAASFINILTQNVFIYWRCLRTHTHTGWHHVRTQTKFQATYSRQHCTFGSWGNSMW